VTERHLKGELRMLGVNSRHENEMGVKFRGEPLKGRRFILIILFLYAIR
jgi:hypothetical protein